MLRTTAGSTGRLIQLCIGLFVFYIITGVTVRYFQYYPLGPMLQPIQYLVYSTIGGSGIALSVVLIFRWYKFKTAFPKTIKGFTFPGEFLYIIPSGVCTAVIILFTTLMYSIKDVSVMVAMVIMRGSIIVISRAVDSIQIKQGILHKKVYFEENMGVLFALIAVSIDLFWEAIFKGGASFDFFTHPVAMTILCSYVGAYALRIYLMNYFKNTRPKGITYDNKGYFAIEQISACLTIVITALILFYLPLRFGGSSEQITYYKQCFTGHLPQWGWAILAGTAFGIVSFFSVFVFMFKGRTATFAGLVNRLVTLMAGTAATVISWTFLNDSFPSTQEWISLVFILIAIGFISAAEKKRSKELLKTHEIPVSVSDEEKMKMKEEKIELTEELKEINDKLKHTH